MISKSLILIITENNLFIGHYAKRIYGPFLRDSRGIRSEEYKDTRAQLARLKML